MTTAASIEHSKTTTLALALRLRIPHGAVLRAVAQRRRDHRRRFFLKHFEEFQHTLPGGRRQRAYRLTRYGMVLTAGLIRNGRAAAIVVEWIDDFNKLEAECLRRGLPVPSL